ncbi:hypothetical protein [Candidatus Laterigemmans baculatus]|uniref:hypothetical protein n=1 Tax=Candidatus Laterigemmans baculatus TaxID=2770505 RepID=UPI00193B381F|nr:hypothetical protein [Candidatus Laterigemmans baculatus]
MTTATIERLTPLPRSAVLWLFSGGLALLLSGCSLVPDFRHRERFHNPLPQLHRIAVLPFFNQSSEPTLNQTAVAEAYYAELQLIPGFEVLPVGVAAVAWDQFVALRGEPREGADFQELARFLGVDAVVVGAVTDYDPYSPPRLAMTVRWYAADPAFHPVPVGYGLPWGTKAEHQIPARIVLETELEVARQQMEMLAVDAPGDPAVGSAVVAPGSEPIAPGGEFVAPGGELVAPGGELVAPGGGLVAPVLGEPVLTHTRLYRGDDPDFTERLADYVYALDDGRLGGWQGYLTRSDDFIRFCCRLHITEMLEMRGGRDKSDLILRWPISRYWR